MEMMTKNGQSERVKTYTKREVAVKVAELSSERISTAEKWVDHLFAALREILTSAAPELRIEIRDFGVFEVKRTKAKPKARNPRTGETIYVPARRKTHFKPSKLLKRFLEQPIEQLDPEAAASPEMRTPASDTKPVTPETVDR